MNKNKILLIALIVFSFFIRTIKLDLLPLFGDEIDVGYQAYSLLTTAKDYKGNLLPVYMHSFTESRAPLLMYFSVPSVAVFGLNEFGVRLTPAIFGVLSIFLLYLIVYRLSKNFTLSLASALILSLTPWHIHYSRTAFEVTLLLSLTLLGVYCFLNYLKNKTFVNLILFILPFALTFYTYNTANIFTPLLASFLVISNLSSLKTNKKFFLSSTAVSLLLVAPILYNIAFGSAANRFKLISVFSDIKTIDSIVIKRTSFSSVSPKIETVFHNKLTRFSQAIYNNYFYALSPFYIFFTGDPNPRHNIPGFGLILGILVIPFLLSFLFFKFKDDTDKFFLFWLIVSPLASALTVDGASHPTRLFIMLPALAYFIAKGSLVIFNFSKPTFYFGSLVFLFSFTSFFHEYTVHFPKDFYQDWQYGYKQLMSQLPFNPRRTFVSNATYSSLPRYLFFQNYPPVLIQNTANIDTEKKNFVYDLNGFSLDAKTYFVNSWNSPDSLNKISTIAQSGDVFVLFQGKDIPGDMNFSKTPLKGFLTLKTVYNPDSTIFGQVIQKL